MGSISSKVARPSATKAGKKPPWAGARVPPYETKTSPGVRAQQPWPSEVKDEEIQRDGKDPQLLANLSRMKPVEVHHHKLLPTGTKDHVKELFESRARAEDDATSGHMPRNRLHVSSLVALLKERQGIDIVGSSAAAATTTTTATTKEQQLAAKYGMDVERVRKLARFVNVPSVRELPRRAGTVVGRDAESGEDVVVREVEWKEPTTRTSTSA